MGSRAFHILPRDQGRLSQCAEPAGLGHGARRRSAARPSSKGNGWLAKLWAQKPVSRRRALGCSDDPDEPCTVFWSPKLLSLRHGKQRAENVRRVEHGERLT